MELLNHFQSFLLQGKDQPSKITVKNYLADVRKFIRWFEARFARPFSPQLINENIVAEYKNQLNSPTQNGISSASSIKRYLSSLRKFYHFLINQGLVSQNPFTIKTQDASEVTDNWHRKEFRNHLAFANISKVTIKNYLVDIRQFITWVEQVTQQEGHIQAAPQPLTMINREMIEEYKTRLLYDAKFEARSVNRKLSSLRKYINWLQKQRLIKQEVIFDQARVPSNPLAKQEETTQQIFLEEEKPASQYSSFPPLRLLQKLGEGSNQLFDLLLFWPVVKLLVAVKYKFWKMTGRQIFVPIETMIEKPLSATLSQLDALVTQAHKAGFAKVSNLPKSLYAPFDIATKDLPLYKKIAHHLQYKRPKWYKKYHSYPLVHYLHFAVALVYATILGLTIYQAIVQSPRFHAPVLAALPGSPPRMLAFEGTLTDSTNTPITTEKTLRFGLYTDPIASDAAMLWEETQPIQPDHNGNFETLLGKNQPLYQRLLTDNPTLFLGITIENDTELTPRQQIATVAYSQDAQKVQGMSPLTDPDAGTKNVLLTLDSGGDLIIGGAASPRFEATGGEFTLAGKTLTLTTTEGSNTNIQLSPDGTGIIDIQKPIQNTTNYSSTAGLEGVVEIADAVAITTNTSSQSALYISQNSTGNFISASGSGTAKFTVNYLGAGMFAGDLSVNGNNLTTTSPIFSLLNTHVINLNIGGSATAIAIGALKGQTTINNSLRVLGSTTLVGSASATGLFTANGGLTIPDGQKLTFNSFSQGAIPFLDGNKQVAVDSNNFFWAQDSKRLGLGTNSPLYRLDVHDSQTGGSVTQIYNTDTGADADGLIIKLGATNPGTANNFISFLNGAGNSMGKITGGTQSGSIMFNTSGADYAEYYRKANHAEIFEQGDLVCIGKNNGVTKCQDGQTLLGVVSTTAGFVGAGNHDNDPNFVLVGIVGQLPVKVASESVPIVSGDALAIGVNGVTKATKKSMIVGHALQSYNPKTDQMVQVALNIRWYEPKETIYAGIIDNIKLGMMEASQMSTKSLVVASENITIGGQTLKEYIVSVATETLNSQLVTSPHIQTDLISPLASESAIALQLDHDKLSIHNSPLATGSAVATIDNQGNASFSGTLRARRIIADEIEGLNVYTTLATPSATFAASPAATLIAEFATFNQGVIALGASSFTDLSLTGTLRLGNAMVISETSIDTLGTDLALQPLRQGNLSLMGELVKIDTEGNLTVEGNATFAKDVSVNGTLAANIITPLPDADLVIKLGQKQSTLIVQDATGSALVTITNKGDLLSSGSGNFTNVAAREFTIIRGAQADTSFTSTVSHGSAGVAVISANERERTIVSPFMKEDSLVYITATSNTQGVTPYVARQTKNSFTVQIPQNVTRDIKFNWWIVN